MTVPKGTGSKRDVSDQVRPTPVDTAPAPPEPTERTGIMDPARLVDRIAGLISRRKSKES